MKYKSKERTRTYLSRLDITNVIVVYVCIENEYEYDPSWHAALHNIYLYVKPHYILLRLIKKYRIYYPLMSSDDICTNKKEV